MLDNSLTVEKLEEERKVGPSNGSVREGSDGLSATQIKQKPYFSIFFRSLICELKNLDESQAERTLTLTKLLFNPKKSSGASTSIIRTLQQVDFLLEYLLMTLLFLLQNR